MPTTERLCHNRDEGDSLLVTLVSCTPQLVVVGKGEGVAWLSGSPSSSAFLEGMDEQEVNSEKAALAETLSQPKKSMLWTNEKLSPIVAWSSSVSISCSKVQSSIGNLVCFFESGNSIVSGANLWCPCYRSILSKIRV